MRFINFKFLYYKKFNINLTIIIFLFFTLFFVEQVKSDNFSCKVNRVGINPETLKVNNYSIIGPSLIIDRQAYTISFSYAEHERRWENIFKIIKEDENSVLGIENLELERVRILLFNKKNKTLSYTFVGLKGNTTYSGKCYN